MYVFPFHRTWADTTWRYCNSVLTPTPPLQRQRQTPQVKGSVLPQTSPTSDASGKWGPQDTCTSEASYKVAGSHDPLRFDDSLE